MLEGAIETSYTQADNACVVATDTLKNTVYGAFFVSKELETILRSLAVDVERGADRSLTPVSLILSSSLLTRFTTKRPGIPSCAHTHFLTSSCMPPKQNNLDA